VFKGRVECEIISKRRLTARKKFYNIASKGGNAGGQRKLVTAKGENAGGQRTLVTVEG
jgi:hypothetical protein